MDKLERVARAICSGISGPTICRDVSDCSYCMNAAKAAIAALEPVTVQDAWEDRKDAMTPEIEADFGTDGFYKRYTEAMELVSNRHSKGALVALVCYLLSFRALAERGE